MDFNEIYHFLFETFYGIGVLVGAGLILTILISVIAERKTRKRFKNHEAKKDSDDSWSFFDDDEEEATKD